MSGQEYIIDRFHAHANVFFTKVTEYEKGVCSKTELAGCLGVTMGTYQCLRVPFPKELNEKYRKVCQLNNQHNIY